MKKHILKVIEEKLIIVYYIYNNKKKLNLCTKNLLFFYSNDIK